MRIYSWIVDIDIIYGGCMKIVRWLKEEESGQGMVEYGLIVMLIAIAALGGLMVLKDGVVRMYYKINTEVS